VTVQAWENGVNTPRQENFETLAKLFGKPADKVVAEWGKWLSKAPEL
jgi:hypothetical protein